MNTITIPFDDLSAEERAHVRAIREIEIETHAIRDETRQQADALKAKLFPQPDRLLHVHVHEEVLPQLETPDEQCPSEPRQPS